MIRVLHVITDLDTGGAEMMLCKLVSAMNRKGFQNRIISLQPPGVLSRFIEILGIHVDSLSLNPHRPNPLALCRAMRIMRQWRPHVVQTWMYHADLLGTLAWMVCRTGALVWNIRCTNMNFSQYRPGTRRVMKMCALLSHLPSCVAANSWAAIHHHRSMGYHPRQTMVIPNGFDLQRFKPDPVLRNGVRRELGVPESAPCVGLVARLDPMKDHAAFFSAASLIRAKRPDTHFVLCGEGVTPDNQHLRACMGDFRDTETLHLLGRRDDVDRMMAGLDIFVLSSAFGESFPNVIGEAMACGVPCVVTDVGDAARIVGDTGMVVPPEDPAAMADAVLAMLELPSEKRYALGMSARERVQTKYSLKKVVTDYDRLYRALAFLTYPEKSGA